MAITPYERRQFSGAAVNTTITGAITSSTLPITIADATGWPDGSVGPFFVVIDPDETTEETIQVLSRTGTTLTVAATGDRGQTGTTATSHASGAPIRHVAVQRDFDEANYTASQTVRKATTAEALMVVSGARAFKELLKGDTGQVLTISAGGLLDWEDIPEPTDLAAAIAAETTAREDADDTLGAGVFTNGVAISTHEALTTTAHGGPYLGATAAAGGALAGNYPNPTLVAVTAANVGTDWPTFSVSKSLTVSAATVTVPTFTTAQEDWRVGWTHTTATADFVANRDMYVNVSASLKVPTSAVTDKEVNIEIRQDGTAIWKSGIVVGDTSREQNLIASGPAKVSSGDVFTVAVYQDFGSSLSCDIKFAATFAGNV